MPTMMKLRIAYIVLCAVFFATSQASYHVMDFELVNSYTFTNNSNIYTVWYTDTHLNLNSTDKNLKSCTIKLTPDIDYIYNRIQVKALTSLRRFIVWGTRDDDGWITDTGKSFKDNTYTILVVDPWNCSHKSVSLKYTRDAKYVYEDIVVVANSDSFDVFLPTRGNCSPCRYDVEGNKVKLDYQLEFPNTEGLPIYPQPRLHIEPIHPTDRLHGYFFSYNFKNDTAVISRLDQHFKILNQLYVDHPVHSVSIWPDKHPLLSICYGSQDDVNISSKQVFEIYCQQLDFDFNSKLSIRLPTIKTNNFVYGSQHLTHQIDPLGNMYVGFIDSSIEKKESRLMAEQLRYFAYDKAGKLLETYDFNKTHINPMTKMFTPHLIFQLHSFLFAGEKFCLVNDEFIGDMEVESHEFVTCFDI